MSKHNMVSGSFIKETNLTLGPLISFLEETATFKIRYTLKKYYDLCLKIRIFYYCKCVTHYYTKIVVGSIRT